MHPHLNYIVDLLWVAFKISKVIYTVMILAKANYPIKTFEIYCALVWMELFSIQHIPFEFFGFTWKMK